MCMYVKVMLHGQKLDVAAALRDIIMTIIKELPEWNALSFPVWPATHCMCKKAREADYFGAKQFVGFS